MSRRITITTITLLLVAAASGHAQMSKGWRRLTFFSYTGAMDAVAANQVDLFKASVERKVRQLAPPAFGDLHLISVAAPLPSAEDTRRRYMSNNDTLALIGGIVSVRASAPPRLKNEVFLGDLRGSFPQQVVYVDLAYDVDEYASTNDAFSAVALYVLAMEQRRVRGARADAVALLSKALNMITDVESKNEGGEDVPILRQAIDQALGDIKGGKW